MVKINIKTKKILFTLALLLVVITMLACSNTGSENNTTGNAVSLISGNERIIAINKLEIYHFHGTNQCYSCIAVGDLAEETVNTYFKDELEKGIIVFDHINGEFPENRDLVIKYGATGSSLWLGTQVGEDFTVEQNVQVWYKINDKTAYMNYLKEVIEQKLAGN